MPLRKQKESELQTAVFSWFKYHKIFAWRMNIGPVFHQRAGKQFWRPNPLKGFPDICGVLQRQHAGVLFAIELKSKQGRVSAEQKTWIDDLTVSGAKVAVVRSLDELASHMRDWGEIP